MIQSTHRFHGRSSLRFVYQHGRQVRNELLGLRAVRNPRKQTWRAAVVVSRKVSKSAVVRNRIRRRLFEVVRLCSGKINGPYDLVFNVYSERLVDVEPTEFEALILGQFRKAGVLKDSATEVSHGIVNNKETQ